MLVAALLLATDASEGAWRPLLAVLGEPVGLASGVGVAAEWCTRHKGWLAYYLY